MAADDSTLYLGLILMATGNDSTTWGDNLNNQFTTIAENGIAGVTAVTLAGTDVNLTQAQAGVAVIDLDGSLTGNVNVNVTYTSPSQYLSRKWLINNQCTLNGFLVTVQIFMPTGSASGAAGSGPPVLQASAVIPSGLKLVLFPGAGNGVLDVSA